MAEQGWQLDQLHRGANTPATERRTGPNDKGVPRDPDEVNIPREGLRPPERGWRSEGVTLRPSAVRLIHLAVH